MRRCLAHLALLGILACPASLRAENPFEVPAPPAPANTRRTAQVFGSDDAVSPAAPARRPAPAVSTAPALKNFQSELFGGQGSAPSAPLSRSSVSTPPIPPRTAAAPRKSQAATSDPFSNTSKSPAKLTSDALRQTTTAEVAPADDQPVLELGFSNSSHRLIDPIPTSPGPAATASQARQASHGESINAGAQTSNPWGETSPAAADEDALADETPNGQFPTTSSQVTHADATFESDASQEAEPPAVSVEWHMAGQLNLGQDCDCELIVTNKGRSTAQHIAVEASLPHAVHVAFTDPDPELADGPLSWRIESLEPGETRKIQLIVVPHESGPIEATALVRYSASSRQTFDVSQPMLQIAVEGPSQVNVGEPAPQTVTVTNPGDGIAANVKLEAAIPEGLEHSRGKRLLMDIGSLNPGETRTVRLALAAVTGGQHIVQVEARADSNLVQNAVAQVEVVAPSLTATIDGPALRYLGREATYTLRVRNDGHVASDNVRLMHKVPEGFDFVRADRGAQFDEATRVLSWFVGRLDSAQSVELKVTLNPTQLGEFDHLVRAISEHGARSDVQLNTRVEGVATLVMDITDLDDPVEVGRETAYEIRIKNEGTASAHQVGLVCELPGGMSFQKASGPDAHKAAGSNVTFQPHRELPAGETLTYRVHVTGQRAGDVRFRCRLASESIQEPLTSEELTKFYGD